jgi:hypothetical protein
MMDFSAVGSSYTTATTAAENDGHRTGPGERYAPLCSILCSHFNDGPALTATAASTPAAVSAVLAVPGVGNAGSTSPC